MKKHCNTPVPQLRRSLALFAGIGPVAWAKAAYSRCTNAVSLGILLALALASTQRASAYDVEFSLTGVITNVTQLSITENCPPSLVPHIGDFFDISLHYNLSVPDADPDPTIGFYQMNRYSVSIFDATLHGIIMESGGALDWIFITNSSSDQFYARCELGVDGYLGVTLNDNTGTALDGDGLPTSFSLLDWDSASFIMTPSSSYSQGEGYWNIMGVIAVPEPTTTTLLGLGSLLLLMMRPHRPRNSQKD